jgi:beta-glucosidase
MCLAPITSQISVASPATADDSWGVGTLTDAEIWNLVSQMTLSEKIGMVNGTNDIAGITCGPGATSLDRPASATCYGQVWISPGVRRLGIPRLRITDGPAGIRLSFYETAMPAPVGLAATFNRAAAALFGSTVGKDGRATNQDVWLAPMINQVVIPTAGRNFETLGEDPYLMGQLVAAEAKAAQNEGLIVTLKHYAMNDFENGRNSTSVALDERSLHEMELQAFEAGIQAGASAIMCSFNRVNDVFACSNDLLQNQILRGIFGFKGFVMTDFGAAHRTSDMIYGLDMAQPGNVNGGVFGSPSLTPAVMTGTAAVSLTNDLPAVPAFTAAEWQATLDQAVFRILKAENAVGLLEGTQYGSQSAAACAPGPLPPCTPYDPPRGDLAALQPSSFAAAQSIAEESATLLRNVNNALPLSAGDLSNLLVMGPTAVATYVGGGGSAHVTPAPGVQSPYDALLAAGGAGANISFVPGYDLDGQVVPASAIIAPATSAFAGQNGWLRTQISTTIPPNNTAPAACSGICAPDQLDATIDYVGANTLTANTAWRWQGTFTAPSAGDWQLKIFVKNQTSAQLFMDGLANNPNRRINIGAYGIVGGFGASTVPTWDGLAQANKSHETTGLKLHQATFSVNFAAGETHNLDLRAYANATDPLSVRFAWVPPDWQTQKISEAVAAAASANKVVIFAFDDGTEGNDRPNAANQNNQALGLQLPGYQDALISAVAAANPNTVVVLNTGDPVFMPWVNDVKAIVEMWYPGQRGGPATANVLLGLVNPSGKLPVTFPNGSGPQPRWPQDDPNCTDTSINGNCPLYPGKATLGFLGVTNHNYRSIDFTTNGFFVGYRWYDKNNVAPLFPFGQGLSYTTFEYRNLVLKAEKDGTVRVSFIVQNKGDVAGTVVPQVYVGAAPSTVQQAVRALRGFDRVELQPNEARRVEITLDARSFQYWDEQVHDWTLLAGRRTIWVGDSSRDLRLSDDVTPMAQ